MSESPINAAKRPGGLRAIAAGLDENLDKDLAQKCLRYAADQIEFLEASNSGKLFLLNNQEERHQKDLKKITNQRDELASYLCRIKLPIPVKTLSAITSLYPGKHIRMKQEGDHLCFFESTNVKGLAQMPAPKDSDS